MQIGTSASFLAWPRQLQRESPLSPADQSIGAADAAPGKRRESSSQTREEQQALLEIKQLTQRDREVRAHEQAHAAMGGRYAGAPSYDFTSGPDGKRYATSGEVSIDTATIPNNPAATLRKMEVVIRAALAPAEPSAQDLRVASEAQVKAAQARAELSQVRRDQGNSEETEGDVDNGDKQTAGEAAGLSSARGSEPALALYKQIDAMGSPTSSVAYQA